MMDKTKSAILDSALALFIEKGYKKTTIREIVNHSGVLIGSIYYYFKNKDDIFHSLIVDVFSLVDEYTNIHISPINSPVCKYAVACTLELYIADMNEHGAELICEGYNSPSILDSLVKHAAMRSERIFEEYNPALNFSDYCRLTLAIKGVTRNFIENLRSNDSFPMESVIDTLLDISLRTYNVPADEIVQTKQYIKNNEEQLRKAANALMHQALPRK